MARTRDVLTQKQLQYVAAWEGDNAKAARAAGYSNPNVAAAKLMKLPAIKRAIRQKQEAVIQQSGEQLGRKISKSDITDSIVEAIEMVKQASKKLAAKRIMRNADVTTQTRVCDTIVKANMALAELQGYILHKNLNYNKMLDDLTEEELERVYRGDLPNLGTGEAPHGSTSPGSDPIKPN